MQERGETDLKPDSPTEVLARTAVLLVNLGTPEAPTPAAVRAYLKEFLLDPRVVEIPQILWRPVLQGVILPRRGRDAAARYAGIWTPEGSPLLVYSRRQQHQLSLELASRGLSVDVELAMRYGEPSLAAAFDRMRHAHVGRILVVPMYPQYSATSTASVLDGVMHWMLGQRDVPELRWVRDFHDDPGYVEALAQSVLTAWDVRGRPDRLLLSFHGLPRRNITLGDPYQEQCLRTAQRLAEVLQLPPDMWAVSFQSRFGRARWIEPYTVDTLHAWGRAGVGRVDVVCPGFVADCLETLEEIAIEARKEFLTAGGREFYAIPCLNDSPRFVSALADLVQRQLQGWPGTSSASVAP